MSDNVNLSLPHGFDNVVRLFPLPNVVLFPGIVQALHLFEPRYRELMEDALSTDQLITMAFVNPDSSDSIRPELSKTVCIGKILSHTLLEDGRFNLFLVGAKRAKIVEEIPTDLLYRKAKVEIVEDFVGGATNNHYLRQEILQKFQELAGLRAGWNNEALEQFLNDDLPFGQLVDMISYSCGASPVDQQRVLEEAELSKRGELVLELISQQVESSVQTKRSAEADSDQSFPPGFSLN